MTDVFAVLVDEKRPYHFVLADSNIEAKEQIAKRYPDCKEIRMQRCRNVTEAVMILKRWCP